MSNTKHDDNLDAVLFHAFDRMSPSAEAEERMMAALAAAQQAVKGEEETTQEPQDEDVYEDDLGYESEYEDDTIYEDDLITEELLGDGVDLEDDLAIDDSFDDDPELKSDANTKLTSSRAFVPATLVLDKQGANTESYRKARRVWNIALPAAACLVLVVGIGALAVGVGPHLLNANLQTGASSNKATPLASSAESAQSAGSDTSPEANVQGMASATVYPIVILSDTTSLRIATGNNGAPLAGDASLVGNEIEAATAQSDSGEQLACTVFVYNDGVHPYAVRYSNDEALYLATPA